MQTHIRRFVEIVIETLPLAQPVYEFGALQVQEDPSEEDLRTLFNQVEYVGCDFRDGPGVDRILNLHAIDLPDRTAGTVISMDTLEHVEYPRQAMSEIHRLLTHDGIVIISSVMNFPIHSYPNDYWRFTPEGFRSLLQDFAHCFVGSCGAQENFPLSIVGIGFKSAPPDLAAFNSAYAQWHAWTTGVMKALNED
ncbi:MAG: methyltransferase domain-containing protein [Porticoccaceae bacterium]|nr:methyltransferase domain-containing protein [Porticoccaceae bacterium]